MGSDDAGGEVEGLVDVGELGGGDFFAIEEEADAGEVEAVGVFAEVVEEGVWLAEEVA